jgi:hypothetical protein
MTARSAGATIETTDEQEAPVTATRSEFNRQVRQTALLSVGLLAALCFGVIVLAGGDWIPGGIIVGASLIGLARQIPVINRLCRTPPPPHHSEPTGSG